MITIRNGINEDIPEIARLESLSFPVEMAANLEKFTEYFSEIKIEESIIIAEERKKIVGFLGYQKEDDNRLYLWNFAVVEDHRSKGVGTMLLSNLIESARIKKFEKIFLEVSINNFPALRIYNRFKFQKKECLSEYYENGENAFRFELSLSAQA